jgi:hypothetical protein
MDFGTSTSQIAAGLRRGGAGSTASSTRGAGIIGCRSNWIVFAWWNMGVHNDSKKFVVNVE